MTGHWFLLGGLYGPLSQHEHHVSASDVHGWVAACGALSPGKFRDGADAKTRRARRCPNCVAAAAALAVKGATS